MTELGAGDAVRQGRRTVEAPVREVRQKARSGRGWYAWVARGGLVAKGVSYGLVGVLAIKLAVGAGGKATSREGALHALAQVTAGEVLLVLLAAGFAAYALWRFVQAVAERCDCEDADDVAKAWGKRVGYVARGLVYGALAWSTTAIVVGGSERKSQNEKAHETTATAFDLPAGRWLVGIAGLAVVGAGVWNLYRGLARKFEDRWRADRLTTVERTWGGRAGVVGHVARAVVFGLIGIFVTKAAIDYDPSTAIGLDGALQKLAQAAYGPYLLGLTATGLVAYGVYCLVDARLRDVSTGD